MKEDLDEQRRRNSKLRDEKMCAESRAKRLGQGKAAGKSAEMENCQLREEVRQLRGEVNQLQKTHMGLEQNLVKAEERVDAPCSFIKLVTVFLP